MPAAFALLCWNSPEKRSDKGAVKMPTIRIDFDGDSVSKKDILALSNAAQKIVSKATDIEDVFVYANSSQIRVKVAPIELYVQMSESKIKNLDKLFEKIKTNISEWKKKSKFPHPINFTLMPMRWKFEIDI